MPIIFQVLILNYFPSLLPNGKRSFNTWMQVVAQIIYVLIIHIVSVVILEPPPFPSPTPIYLYQCGFSTHTYSYRVGRFQTSRRIIPHIETANMWFILIIDAVVGLE